MKLIVLGDLHDNLRHFNSSIKKINNLRPDIIAFVGDFDMPFTMRAFTQLKAPIKAVLGNGDPDIQKFQYQLQNLEVLKGLNLDISPRFQDFTLENRRIGIFHGDDSNLVNFIIETEKLDVLCIGHTHIPEIISKKKTIIINPGSFVGWMLERGNMPIHIGVYDTESNKAELLEILSDSNS